MSKRRCLVTGANGFLGLILCQYLKDTDRHVVAVTRSPENNLSADEVRRTDFSQPDFPENLMEEIDEVYHLGGIAHSDPSTYALADYVRINTEATVELIKMAEAASVKSFVFISSVLAEDVRGMVYKEVEKTPEYWYAFSKLEAERQILDYEAHSPMRINVLRLPLIYGPGVKGNLARMLSAVQRNWFPALPPQVGIRSMLSCEDSASAMAILAGADGITGKCLTVADGEQYSAHRIATGMRSALRKSGPVWYLPGFILKLIAKAGELASRLFSMQMPRSAVAAAKLLAVSKVESDPLLFELGWQPSRKFEDLVPEMASRFLYEQIK